MVVKVYVSGISGNKEVKKRQQRVLMILDSKNIKYDVIDITEPGREADKEFMQNNSKSNGGTVSDPNPRSALPPQVFNDEDYCGDYDQFDLANEVDTLEQFLKVEVPPEVQNEQEKTLNGDLEDKKKESKESSQERDTKEASPASREATPASNDKESSPAPEKSTEKEKSPENESDRAKSVEKEASPVKEDVIESTTHENDEAVNENGKTSSREQSEEKESAQKDSEAPETTKDLSSALIESEQQVAAE